ncbi:MAG: hypothetical protein ACOC8E_06220 [Planctomycetota bacterium]
MRYVFLAADKTEYADAARQVRFSGTRGILTIRENHLDVVLLDGGEIRYRGKGIGCNEGMVKMRLAPGGFATGETSGRHDKRLHFYGLGKSPGSLRFSTDGMNYIATGSSDHAVYGVRHGSHTITVEPR